MAENLTQNAERKVELNERISETQYDVLYPVTKAEYVNTDNNHLFVTEEEKDAWNKVANQANLVWKGNYVAENTYVANDVVYYNGKYYVAKGAVAVGQQPTDESQNDNYWWNLNLEAYAAKLADQIKVGKLESNQDFTLILQGDQGDTGYYNVGVGANLTYNPSTKQFKIGDSIILDGKTGEITGKIKGMVEGKADEAGHADEADYAEVANQYVVEWNKDEEGQNTTVKTTQSIAEKFAAVEKTIEAVSGGAAQKVANALTIKMDGTEKVVFDGSEEKEVDIKQTYATADITDLLGSDKKKIDTKWLPDSVLGQLEYQGTWDAGVEGSTIAGLEKGWYYIVSGNGNYAPNGKLMAESDSTEPWYFETGDWAVYNGTAWDKIDNTDAVRTVNGQIGDIETYKGDWTALTNYYKGDIIKNDGKLYICNANHKSGTGFEDTNWELFGRTYTGDDIITVAGDKITHKAYDTNTTTSETITLDKTGVFTIPSIATDNYGHITGITRQPYALGADFIDTVRAIKVNNVEKLSNESKNAMALNFIDSDKIKVAFTDNALVINHDTLATAVQWNTSEETTTLVAGSKFKIPTITVDGYGHVTAGEYKEFTMTASPVTHDHFNVVSEDGIQKIRAYNTTEATSEWLGLAANKGKFYWGDADTLRVNSKWGATELYQGTNKVVDSSVSFDTGYTWKPITVNNVTTLTKSKLDSKYNADTNSIEMADTGVEEGVYSAVRVNAKGLVCAGGQIIEFGTEKDAGPSDNLAVGGLFFRKIA